MKVLNIKPQRLYIMYDEATERFYKRGGWYRTGQKPGIFRASNHLKAAINALMDSDVATYPPMYVLDRKLRESFPGSTAPDFNIRRKLAQEQRLALLPESYVIYELTAEGLVLIGKAKEWY
jgi:hypothetical protein